MLTGLLAIALIQGATDGTCASYSALYDSFDAHFEAARDPGPEYNSFYRTQADMGVELSCHAEAALALAGSDLERARALQRLMVIHMNWTSDWEAVRRAVTEGMAVPGIEGPEFELYRSQFQVGLDMLVRHDAWLAEQAATNAGTVYDRDVFVAAYTLAEERHSAAEWAYIRGLDDDAAALNAEALNAITEALAAASEPDDLQAALHLSIDIALMAEDWDLVRDLTGRAWDAPPREAPQEAADRAHITIALRRRASALGHIDYYYLLARSLTDYRAQMFPSVWETVTSGVQRHRASGLTCQDVDNATFFDLAIADDYWGDRCHFELRDGSGDFTIEIAQATDGEEFDAECTGSEAWIPNSILRTYGRHTGGERTICYQIYGSGYEEEASWVFGLRTGDYRLTGHVTGIGETLPDAFQIVPEAMAAMAEQMEAIGE